MSREPLTPLESMVLGFIVGYQSKWGFSPTIREIAKSFNMKSTKSAFNVVEQLAAKDYIKKYKFHPRGIEVK